MENNNKQHTESQNIFEAVEASTTEVVLSSSRETIRPQLEDDGSDSVRAAAASMSVGYA